MLPTPFKQAEYRANLWPRQPRKYLFSFVLISASLMTMLNSAVGSMVTRWEGAMSREEHARDGTQAVIPDDEVVDVAVVMPRGSTFESTDRIDDKEKA